MDTLVSRLQELMSEYGDDQSSLARKIGCTPAAINQILTGRTQRSRLLPEIADVYDVSLAYLQARSNDRGPHIHTEERMTREDRRLVSLAQRLDRQDRALVMALTERLAGAARLALEEATEAVSGQSSLHEKRLRYNPG